MGFSCLVIGTGAVGARAARQLDSFDSVERVVVCDGTERSARDVASGLGASGEFARDLASFKGDLDVVVIATPAATHVELASQGLDRGAHVISVADSIPDIRGLLKLNQKAEALGLCVAVGAGFAPGLSCLLARHGAASFDLVQEIHVAKAGTGGPACARQHHRALGGHAVDFRDGAFLRRRGRTGRELCWFPEPIDAQDCYRAALGDAYLLVPAFDGVERVTARVAANRRNRLSAIFPMLRPPHLDGGPGGLRVELRGTRGQAKDIMVFGVMDHPANGAGTVAAVVAEAACSSNLMAPGARGLAQVDEPLPLLNELAYRGVRAAIFEGSNQG